MESPHPDERPLKKRRFFAHDSSPEQLRSQHPTSTPPPEPPSPIQAQDGAEGGQDADGPPGFDLDMLQAIVGELPSDVLAKLKDVSGNDVQRGEKLSATWHQQF
jgi:DNA repair protein RAD5